jgi:hydrogenase nickel incorporation protein HypA/HybF
MHETALCQGIVDAVLRRAGGRRVSSIRVRLGGHPLDPAVIQQGVAMAAAGTVAQDAALDLVVEPLRVYCRRCRRETPADSPLAMAACVRCGGVDIEMLGSDEAVLESISYHANPREEGRWTPLRS